mgnify:CR=1 FL=1
MIDVANIKYRLVVMTEDKKQYNIKEFVENLGWEENDGELAVRISFTAKNDQTSAGLISSCKAGMFGRRFCISRSIDEEVARGILPIGSLHFQGAKISSMLLAMTNCIICRRARSLSIIPLE